jgi:hypothetical protein
MIAEILRQVSTGGEEAFSIRLAVLRSNKPLSMLELGLLCIDY